MSQARALPVLMYHYVSAYTGSINVSPEHFFEQCRGMAAHGWRGVGLDEAEAYLLGRGTLDAKSVLITFDDGFLDNHVYAAPILREHGHKGVVFAVTDRLEAGSPSGESPRVRPSCDPGRVSGLVRGPVCAPPSASEQPVAHACIDHPIEQHCLGYTQRKDLFLNWDEARTLEADGTLALAAHTARHELVFASGRVPARTGATADDADRRFHCPGRRGNTFYRLYGDMAWGMPRLPERPAMSGPAFVPSPDFVAAVRDLVPQETAAAYAFFQSPEQLNRLHDLVDRLAVSGSIPGQMEEPDATSARMRSELQRCAHKLRCELGHGVRSLCWPWGRGSERARQLAIECGFDVFFETRSGPALPGCHVAVPRFKVRDKGWPWLHRRLFVYAQPFLGALYARLKG